MARTHAGAVAARTPETVDIAIITVLKEEYEAVRERLKNPRRDPGTQGQPNQYAWMLGEIEHAEGGRYQVVVAMAGSPGTTSSSIATSKTIGRWRPRYVLLVGIAGGLMREGLTLGDVVVSSLIRAYEYGKIKEGRFEPRPDFQYTVDGSLHRNALSLSSKRWQKGLGRQPGPASARSKVLTGPIASGDKVVDDVSSEFFAAVAKSFPKLLAVEMEGSGAAAAIEAAKEEGHSVGFLMIRGISDMPPAASSKQEGASGTRRRFEASRGTPIPVMVAEERFHVGIRLAEVGPGWAESSLEMAPQHFQTGDFVHEGLQATMVNHAAGAAAGTLVSANQHIMAVEFRVNLLRPAIAEHLTCQPEVLKAASD